MRRGKYEIRFLFRHQETRFSMKKIIENGHGNGYSHGLDF